ncbi:Transposase IS116/IS110/IS902 family protein [Clostridium sp. C105KSO15]|nr:Transposase IS116/IS110/IS902 family protein [Clostridium sp. C105KSO15]
MQRFIKLKELASSTVGYSNEIFETQLITILNLYRLADSEVKRLETDIISLVTELNPQSLTIPGIGPISAAVIASEYGDISRFSSPSQMLSFAGLEPGYFQSGTMEFKGKMVKRGSSQLRYTLINCTMPLIMYNMVFAEYYHKKHNEGKSHRVALNHVAKKLIRVIYTLETQNIPFDDSKLR